MLRKFLVCFCIVLLLITKVFTSSSQGIDNIWLMGYDSWAGPPYGSITWDFSINPVNINLQNRKMNFLETDASYCDKNGNILFYTNGLWVANSLNDTMFNGSGLYPSPIATAYIQYGLPLPQAALIIPFPGDSNKYYLFHETIKTPSLYFPSSIDFSIIDLSLDTGLGGLIIKNNILYSDTIAGCEITATKHANGRDWWLIQHKLNSNLIYTFLISPFGISGPFSQQIGIIKQSGIQASFTSNGNKFASYNTLDDLEIYDFDRCSGLLSNAINVVINDSMVGGGVAFSPSGRYLYASSVLYVYQFDLLAANIPASMQTVAVWDGTYSPAPPFAATFYLMQLAPDGKIYINCQNSTVDMHVINYPDSAGLACDLQQHSVHLPAFNAFSIPNHPNYFLGALAGSPCDSLNPVAEINNNNLPIRINPNPAQNIFYLNYELPYGKTAIATIYNTLGEVVMRKALYWYFGYLQIDCSTLNNGVYFIKVEGKGIGGSTKVVILR